MLKPITGGVLVTPNMVIERFKKKHTYNELMLKLIHEYEQRLISNLVKIIFMSPSQTAKDMMELERRCRDDNKNYCTKSSHPAPSVPIPWGAFILSLTHVRHASRTDIRRIIC